jgi:hypothetical protein
MLTQGYNIKPVVLLQAWYTGVMELMRSYEGLTIYCGIKSIIICVRQARQEL